MNRNQFGNRNPNFKGGKLLSCEVCGKKRYFSPSAIKTYKHHFCSNKCSGIFRKKGVLVNCFICNKELYRTPSQIKVSKSKLFFCSKCSHKHSFVKGKKYNGEKRCGKNNSHWKGGKITLCCAYCSKPLKRFPSQVKDKENLFCNEECHNNFMKGKVIGHRPYIMTDEIRRKMSKAKLGKYTGENHPRWKDGISFEPYPPTFNSQLKERVRVRDNFICQKCGIPELEYMRKLDVHHIDYDKKNCEMDNLISLCGRCNATVNSNREYWTNYFNRILKKEKDIIGSIFHK